MSGPDSLKMAGSWELGTQEGLCCGVFPRKHRDVTSFLSQLWTDEGPHVDLSYCVVFRVGI